MKRTTAARVFFLVTIGTLCVAAQAVADLEPAHHWRFDSTFEDSVGDSDGTADGAQLSDPSSSGVSRILGNAVYFDGVGDYVSLPQSVLGAGSFSISLWSYAIPKGGTGFVNGYLLHDATNSIPYPSKLTMRRYDYTYNDAGGQFDGYINDVSLGPFGPGGTTTGLWPGEEWYHHVLTVDDDNRLKWYVNGNPTPEVTREGVVFGGLNSYLYVGNHVNTSTDHSFKGFIDELQIYTRALDAEEVVDLYNSVPEPGSVVLLLCALASLGIWRRR